MRIALKGQGVGWVVDSIVDDYKKFSRHEIVGLGDKPDVFWCVNLFSFPQMLGQIPKGCKKYLQMHHINEDQIDEYNFDVFNRADVCIVPNKITEAIAKEFLDIPVYRIPYWLLSKTMVPSDKEYVAELRREQLTGIELLIGSFVKDGNGKYGSTPKIAKNPDLLVEVLDRLNLEIPEKIKAVLGGYCRKYVANELDLRGVPCTYLMHYPDINSLYDILDYYISTSKYEGGPQSVLEASYRKIKILSTPVGLAPEILHSNCLCRTAEEFSKAVVQKIDECEYNYQSVQGYLPEKIIPKFDDLFETGELHGS